MIKMLKIQGLHDNHEVSELGLSVQLLDRFGYIDLSLVKYQVDGGDITVLEAGMNALGRSLKVGARDEASYHA